MPWHLTCNLIRQKKRAESSTQGFWDRKLSISCLSELNLDFSRRRSAAFLRRGTRESRTCSSTVQPALHGRDATSGRTADCCCHLLYRDTVFHTSATTVCNYSRCNIVWVDVVVVYHSDRHTAAKSAAATGIFFGLSALSSKPSSTSSSMPIMRVLPHSAS